MDESTGLSSAQLARRAFVTAQTMNRIVGNLKSGGLIERGPHPDVGRVLEARLSERGRGLLAECHQRIQHVEARMVKGLTAGERRQLAELLERCATNLRPSRRRVQANNRQSTSI